jgi:predicted dienelactone hydrolase
MNRRALLALATATLIVSCSSTPNQATAATVTVTPSYGPEVGTQAVGVIPEASLHDGKRNKDLPLAIDYPIYGGPYPVIIFSHGYGGSNRAYEPLASYWTSNGYVVIRPDHHDANALRDAFESSRMPSTLPQQGRGGRRPDPKSASKDAAKAPEPATLRQSIEAIWEKEREPQWRDRAADISLVIDSLDELEQRFPELKGKMDHAKIGVGGHSYGAFTTMLVSGTRTFSTPPLAVRDPRVKAGVAMSPQGVSENRGLTADSWRDVTIPMLYMTGSQDYGPEKSEDPAWRKTAYDHSPAGDKYFAEIEGANHFSFTGRLGFFEPYQARATSTQQIDPRTGRATMNDTMTPTPRSGPSVTGRGTLRTIRDISLAFWDAALKGDAKGKEFLQTKVASDVVKAEHK